MELLKKQADDYGLALAGEQGHGRGELWITAAPLVKPGTYRYVFLTEDQATPTIWKGMTLEGRSYLSYIPEQLVVSQNLSKLRIKLKNGSLIQFVGASAPSRLQGAGIKGGGTVRIFLPEPQDVLGGHSADGRALRRVAIVPVNAL